MSQQTKHTLKLVDGASAAYSAGREEGFRGVSGPGEGRERNPGDDNVSDESSPIVSL